MPSPVTCEDDRGFPLRCGMLRANAASLDADFPSDVAELFLDGCSGMTAIVLSLRCDPERRRPALRDEARVLVREVLMRRASMCELVSALRRFAASEASLTVGVVALRAVPLAARVEILNAGMPAVVCVGSGGKLSAHAALSAAIGARYGALHPCELAPFKHPSTWILASEGLTSGLRDPDAVTSFLQRSGLSSRAPLLARVPRSALTNSLEPLSAPTERSRFGGASFAVIDADHRSRFHSEIAS